MSCSSTFHIAALTLEKTLSKIPMGVGDDASNDTTVEIAKRLGIFTVAHERNRGIAAISPHEGQPAVSESRATFTVAVTSLKNARRGQPIPKFRVKRP